MKNNLFVLILGLICFTPVIINSCKKENTPSPPTNIGTAISFTEEFENVNELHTKDWVMKDNSPALTSSGPNAAWVPIKEVIGQASVLILILFCRMSLHILPFTPILIMQQSAVG